MTLTLRNITISRPTYIFMYVFMYVYKNVCMYTFLWHISIYFTAALDKIHKKNK